MKLNELRRKAWYKEQNRFVAYDSGPVFKSRYGVMGLTAEDFELSRWFRRESEAAAYCADVVRATEKERPRAAEIDQGRSWSSKVFWAKEKARGGKRSKMRRDCAFKGGCHG